MSESESLLPSMGRLLILMMQFLERGQTDRDLENLFQEEFKKNRRILKRMEKQKNLDVWDHFLLGGSLGVQGLYELEHKSYWSAFIHGLSALSHLKEVQRLNPEVYDVYFSHGVYKYFRSVKMRYLWFLPLIGDQRKEGIEEIHVALDKGHYSVPACKIAVVILAEREKEDEHGLVLGEKYLKEFPRSLLIRKALAEIYERNDRGLDAARIYRDAYHEDPSIRWVLLKAGQGFYHHHFWEQAEESFHTYLASDPPPPGAAEARAGLSNIYRSRGDMKRAREEWERAVLLDPVWNKRKPEELQ